MLLLLVTNHGHVLTKDEMLKQLWPDTFVEEGIIAQYISLLRKALGDEGKSIQNLPRRGYRFTAAVEESRDDVADAPRLPSPASLRYTSAASPAWSDSDTPLIALSGLGGGSSRGLHRSNRLLCCLS